MQRRSPPKHRHDGTSPLPLGMDWSPPPRRWNGKDTVWPHDPRTGWSYCVTIPSWAVLPRSRDSEPVVFYRVQVGIQSPEGVTTTRTVLRRFNDFLRLFTDLKKAFPEKTLPPAPPKGLLRLKSRALLEERRCSLEEWMRRLLSDIDLSRSVAVASFLELEAAARSSFQDINQQSSEANSVSLNTTSPSQAHPPSSSSVAPSSSSITPEYGSDTAYETSEAGTPKLGKDYNSEIGVEDVTVDEHLGSPIENLVKYGIYNIDEGLFMGQTILDQLEGFPKHKVHTRHLNSITKKDVDNVNASGAPVLVGNGMELFLDSENRKVSGHARELSNESAGSDMSSLRGSEISNSGFPGSSVDSYPGVPEISSAMGTLRNSEMQLSGNSQLVVPLDQRHKLNRILGGMQQRLVTAKTDMEDLVARLNQEIAVKDYLATKVKDLEVELDVTRQKSKDNLQQAVQIERDRFTQMQWDMEELRRKSLELELKLKSEQAEKSSVESTTGPSTEEDILREELGSTKEQLDNLLKQYQDLEVRSKADIKVLIKEVKSLRRSQTELTQKLSSLTKEKSETEELLQQERRLNECAKIAGKKLLQECCLLHRQLQECIVSFPLEDDCNNSVVNSFSVADASGLLRESDEKISLLLEKVQHFIHGSETSELATEKTNVMDCDTDSTYDELRKMLGDIFIDNARLRRQVSFVTRHAIEQDTVPKKVEKVAPEATE